MLLAGVKFDPFALNRDDIEGTKGRARTSGRSFGGAPLRNGNNGPGYGGGYQNGGGRINYAAPSDRDGDRDPRPNPFAQHIQPGFVPPPYIANRDGYNGSGGRQAYQPPLQQQGYYDGYPPQQQSYRPPQGNYNNSYGPPSHPPPVVPYGGGSAGGYGGQQYPQQQPFPRGYDRPERPLPEGYGYNRR